MIRITNLPNEILDMISQKVKNVKDYLSLRSSCRILKNGCEYSYLDRKYRYMYEKVIIAVDEYDYLRSIKGSNIWKKHLTKKICANRDLGLLQWVLKNEKELEIEKYAMDAAALFGCLEIVQWLHENRTEGCTTEAMNEAARNGHLDIVKWLHENRTEGCTTEAMDEAADNGHLEVIQWLHENRTEGCSTNAMDWAAAYGHLEVVKWLHENRTEGCTEDAMDEAALSGELEVVKWLHENRKEGCFNNWVINEAAFRGHLEVVKYLKEHVKNKK